MGGGDGPRMPVEDPNPSEAPMQKIKITVTHRGNVHNDVEIVVPTSLEDAVENLGEDAVYEIFMDALKTKLAGKAWQKFESAATGKAIGKRAAWKSQLK
jgi:hypothetical protein